MKTATKIILAAAAIGTLGLGGLTKTVSAEQSPVAVMPQHHRSSMMNSMMAEARNEESEANERQEPQEATQLQRLAKITPQQAQQAAEASQGGKSSSVKLENEDGNLVYAVRIGQKEVKVDAGNGQVLYTEARNQEDKATEASRPRSSIQVPNTQRGDRETNDDQVR